jgi:uncharacterized protein
VLAKAPVPGRVKTRLCPPATPAQAARIASAALLDTLDAVLAAASAMPVVPVVALHGEIADVPGDTGGPALAARLRGVTVLPQRGTTLGARIAAAHADAAAATGTGPVLQIGMDTPQVDAALLGRCLDALMADGVDAVLGPATDGGWWVLGVREAATARLIAEVPTSRADTGPRSSAALRAGGCRVRDLPELPDVDTWRDAVAVAAGAPHGRFAAAVLAARSELAPATEPAAGTEPAAVADEPARDAQ